jgi:hypothetical protein
MTPVSSWGKTFVVPVTKRGVERVKIVASQGGTVITQSGGIIKTDGGGKNSLTLERGEFVEMEIYLDSGGCYISSNNPIGVASYLVGMTHAELKYGKGTLGDPALTVVPPIEQMVFSADIAPFISLGTTNLIEHHIMIITPTATCNQTTVTIGNGMPTALIGGSWTIGNGLGAAYSFYTMPLTSSTDAYHFANPHGLLVMGFGLGERESYYYLSGAAMRTLEASFTVDDNHYLDLDDQTICVGSEVSFRAGGINPEVGATGYLKWYIDGTEDISKRDVLQWTRSLTNGSHTVSIDVTDKCRTYSFTTTFEVINRAVATDITANDTSICYNTTATIIAIASDVPNPVYKWYSSKAETTPFYTGTSYTTSNLTADTTFYISVSGTDYCENSADNRKEVRVTVYDSLTAGSISDLQPLCYKIAMSTIFLGNNSPSGGSGIYTYQWQDSTAGNTWKNIGTAQKTYGISGALPQTTYYRRIVSDSLCGTAYSDAISVQPVPVISADTLKLCIRNTITLPPAIDGIWTSDKPSVVKIVNNEIAEGISAGNAKLTYRDTIAGGSCSEEIEIAVYNFPVVAETTGKAVVCQGLTIQLSNPTPNGVWTKNNNNVSFDDPNANPVTVTGVTQGKTFITYTVSNPNYDVCQTTKTFRLKVTSNPPSPPTIIIGFER